MPIIENILNKMREYSKTLRIKAVEEGPTIEEAPRISFGTDSLLDIARKKSETVRRLPEAEDISSGKVAELIETGYKEGTSGRLVPPGPPPKPPEDVMVALTEDFKGLYILNTGEVITKRALRLYPELKDAWRTLLRQRLDFDYVKQMKSLAKKEITRLNAELTLVKQEFARMQGEQTKLARGRIPVTPVGALGATKYAPEKLAAMPTDLLRQSYAVKNIQIAIDAYKLLEKTGGKETGFWKDVLSAIGDTFKEPMKMLPFYGSMDSFLEMDEAIKAGEKLERGEDITDYERSLIEKHRAKNLPQIRSMGYGVGKIVSDMPTFMAEFGILKGVIYEPIKAGVEKLIGTTVPAKIASTIIGATAQGLTNVPEIAERTAMYLLPNHRAMTTPEWVGLEDSLDEKVTFTEALAKAIGTTVVDYVTEHAGVLVQKPTTFLKRAVLGKWLTKRIGKIGLIEIPENLLKIAEKVGWHGIIAEVFEEEMAELLQAPIEGRKYYAPFLTPEGTERILTETLGIAAFGGLSNIPSFTIAKISNWRAKNDWPTISLGLSLEDITKKVKKGAIISVRDVKAQFEVLKVDKYGKIEAKNLETGGVSSLPISAVLEVAPAKVPPIIPEVKPPEVPPLISEEGKIRFFKEGIKPTVAAEKLAKQIQKSDETYQRFGKDKLNLPTEHTAEITKRLGVLGLEKRSVRTFDDIMETARELGTDPARLLRETESDRITAAEAVALKNMINLNAQMEVRLNKQLQDLSRKMVKATSTERKKLSAQRVVLNTKLVKAEAQINIALTKLIKGGTEGGRLVASFKIMARNTLDPDFWFRKARKMLGTGNFTQEMRFAITDLINNKDLSGLAEYVSMLRKPIFVDKVSTLWKAGLLTSPTTHLANIGGNITMAGLLTLSDIPATGLDILIGLFTGQRTVTISPRTWWAEAKGLVKGAKEAKEFMKTGIYPAEILRKYDLPPRIIFKNKFLRGYTNAVFRSLGGEDIAFRQAAMSYSLEKGAILTAKNEGLKGEARKIRIKELLLSPTNEMVVNAIDAAEYATFQNPNMAATLVSKWRGALRGMAARSANKGEVHIAAQMLLGITEFIAPFTRTPSNIAARIADFSPLGFVKGLVRVANPATRSQKNFVEDISRAITGTGFVVLGAYLAKAGLLTAGVPKDKKERDMFYAEGKQPYSLKVSGTWLRLERISPAGNLLALGAMFETESKELGGVPLAIATAAGGMRALTEQTYLRGVSSAMRVINEPDRAAANYLRQAIASFIPTVLARIAKIFDPKLRVSNDVLDSILYKIPGLSRNVSVRRGIWGEPVVVPGGRFNIVDPFQMTKDVRDPVIEEARRIDVVIGLPGYTVSRTKMTAEEFSDYQEIHGRILKRALTQLMESAEYKELPTTEKKETFEKIMREARKVMNNTLFPALMMRRYNLPLDTNPQALREILNEMMQHKKFKNFSTRQQERVIKGILDNLKEFLEKAK